jgi:26S proteasome regulatory subunit N1
MVEKKAVAITVPAADNSPVEEDKPLKKMPQELKDAPIKDELVRHLPLPRYFFYAFRH